MEKLLEIYLTGTDGQIDGIARQVYVDGNTWEFKSIDESVYLLVEKDNEGTWSRIDGSEPYLSAWIDELGEKITNNI